MAPALVETYSRLLVYTEIESLGIKGFLSESNHPFSFNQSVKITIYHQILSNSRPTPTSRIQIARLGHPLHPPRNAILPDASHSTILSCSIVVASPFARLRSAHQQNPAASLCWIDGVAIDHRSWIGRSATTAVTVLLRTEGIRIDCLDGKWRIESGADSDDSTGNACHRYRHGWSIERLVQGSSVDHHATHTPFVGSEHVELFPAGAQHISIANKYEGK